MIFVVVLFPKFADNQLGFWRNSTQKQTLRWAATLWRAEVPEASSLDPTHMTCHKFWKDSRTSPSITIWWYNMIYVTHQSSQNWTRSIWSRFISQYYIHYWQYMYYKYSDLKCVIIYIYPKIFVFWGTNCTSDILVAGSWQSCSHGAGRWALGSEELGQPEKPWETSRANLGPSFFLGGTQMHS